LNKTQGDEPPVRSIRWSLARTHATAAVPNDALEVSPMLYTTAAILILAWALGLAMSYTLGGLLHLLLVVAIVLVVADYITGKKVY
jgi:hypothetical protein